MQNNAEACSQPCIVCGQSLVTELAAYSRSGKPLRTVICENCGMVWSDPFPHNPRSFYEDDYRVAYKGTYTPKPKHILRAGRVALARRNLIQEYIRQPKKILDVGTGGGEFAYLLHSLGHKVFGIEPNKGYAEYSRKEYDLTIQIGFIQDIEQPDNSFDLITIWHVLEHTENPATVLSKLHDLLKPEGILVVEVPNIEATCQSPKSTFHEAHIFNFNLQTLTALGAKTGLSLVEYKVSKDNANITLFFSKDQKNQELTEQAIAIPDNADAIKKIVKGHTHFQHYLTLKPYQRLISKLCQALDEKKQTTHFISGKTLLDQLYEKK
jgi:2-polyprenyl-3-methyl-5-hydroxy-6-metoxy-1,4-benzoquinol methylase